MADRDGLDRPVLARGRNATVYEWEPGTVLRVDERGQDRTQIERETARLEAARAAGAPVPAVRDIVEVGGRYGMVVERADGPDLLAGLVRRPWRLRQQAEALAALHATIVATPAPEGADDLHRALTDALAEPDPVVPDEARRAALALLGSLPTGDRLLHGDFHPGNVLTHGDGLMVIDWENLAAGPPTADHAATALLLRHADPPDAPRPLRLLIDTLRGRYASTYERAFRARVAIDPDELARWTYVLATARLRERIPEERATLLGLVAEAPG